MKHVPAHNSIHGSKEVGNKTPITMFLLRTLIRVSKKLWDFKVYGKENIPKNGSYILCPNHQNHFDGLWIFGCLPNDVLPHICCLAKQEHLDNGINRFFLKMLGGIPVDRSGNAVPAIRDCIRKLKTNETVLLIHPEGTRTKTGVIGEFKRGAAKIAIDTNTCIVPVCIIGAFDVFPPQRKYPDIWGHKTISIVFGIPIYPDADTSKELTNKGFSAVTDLYEKRDSIEYRHRC